MTKTRMLSIGLVLAMVAISPIAIAKPAATDTQRISQPITPLPSASAMMLADNVVVTPQGTAAQPAPAPQAAPAQINVQPGAQAAQPAPVVEQPRKVVHSEVAPNRNYMSTIFVSALMGGLAGALIGGAVYYLDDQDRPINVAYWAAGGVLLGTGVGIAQVVVQENRVSNATAMNRLPSDPAPTYRLALFQHRF